MGAGYPLFMKDYRPLPEGFDGAVFVWDIDKTYLATHFSSLRGLARIPIEFAVDKGAIPGMPEILRGLRKGPGSKFACAPLYFVTASPPQLRKVLEQRMLLDGVEFDGITFKDWLRTIRERRPGRLREQAGFKICALIAGRIHRPAAREYLFGDDTEADAEAFHLYAGLMHGDLAGGEAEKAMEAAGVKKDDRRAIFSLLDRLPKKRGEVKRIFIHLAAATPPEAFQRYGGLVAPVRDAFQLGLALFASGLVDGDTVRRCRKTLFPDAEQKDTLHAQVADAVARGLISKRKAGALKL